MLQQHVNPTVLIKKKPPDWRRCPPSLLLSGRSLHKVCKTLGRRKAASRQELERAALIVLTSARGATRWRLGPIKMCDLLLSYLEDVSFNLSEHAALRRPVWQIWRMRWWTAGNQVLVLSSAIRWRRHTVVTQANAPTGMFIRHACAKGMDGHVHLFASCPALAAHSIWCGNHKKKKKTWRVFLDHTMFLSHC